MSVAALNNIQVRSWRNQTSRRRSEFLAAISSKRAVLTRRKPVDRTVLSWPWVPRGYLGRPSASFDVQQRKKPEHKARRDRMELSRPYSYGRGDTAWIRSESEQEASQLPVQIITDRRRDRTELRNLEDKSSSGIKDRPRTIEQVWVYSKHRTVAEVEEYILTFY